jgi:hypothetical protein
MKKLVLGLSLLGATNLFADYQLTLIDKHGVETNQCIKSYSFSNNLESLARKNNVGLKDVYSEEETMTNKVFMGKPVYRKIFILDDFTVYKNTPYVKYSGVVSENIEKAISLKYTYKRAELNVMGDSPNMYVVYGDGHHIYDMINFDYTSKKIVYTIQKYTDSSPWIYKDFTLYIEYTKTTDSVNSPENTFKSYLHYVPSLSTTNDVTTIDLKDTGARFLEGFTYDSTTDSCTKN